VPELTPDWRCETAYPLLILLPMPSRPLSFDVLRDGDEAHLGVAGEIDMATAPDLEQAALALLDERPRRLVLDFSGVPFCDSSGIGMLVRLYNKATVSGCRLSIRQPTPNVRAILDMTALTKIFHIDDPADPPTQPVS
jgi:anti-sigma B factor antagonist